MLSVNFFSSVLDRVKNFLPLLKEANDRLHAAPADNKSTDADRAVELDLDLPSEDESSEDEEVEKETTEAPEGRKSKDFVEMVILFLVNHQLKT